MERCPTQAVLPLVGLAAENVIRDRYHLTTRVDDSLTKSKAIRRTIQEIEARLTDWQQKKQKKPKPLPRKKKKRNTLAV
ncbi:MAG: hypothetical protein ACQESR_18460 [Planctomycetota bacterium]